MFRKEGNCPHCGYQINCATGLDPEVEIPEPNDLNVCINCGEPSKFGPQLELVKLTDEEQANLDIETSSQIFIFQMAMRIEKEQLAKEQENKRKDT